MTAPLQLTRSRHGLHHPRWQNKASHPLRAGRPSRRHTIEFSLRPFVAGWNEPEGDIRTVRNYIEGFSVAHFEADGLAPLGNRVTGNPPLQEHPNC
jgi:hypothetical protein